MSEPTYTLFGVPILLSDIVPPDELWIVKFKDTAMTEPDQCLTELRRLIYSARAEKREPIGICLDPASALTARIAFNERPHVFSFISKQEFMGLPLTVANIDRPMLIFHVRDAGRLEYEKTRKLKELVK